MAMADAEFRTMPVVAIVAVDTTPARRPPVVAPKRLRSGAGFGCGPVRSCWSGSARLGLASSGPTWSELAWLGP